MFEALQEQLQRLGPDSVLTLAAPRLCRFYSRVLLRLALKYFPEERAEDLVQIILARVVSHFSERHSLPPLGQRRWLARVVRNEAFAQLRKQRRRREQSLEQ